MSWSFQHKGPAADVRNASDAYFDGNFSFSPAEKQVMRAARATIEAACAAQKGDVQMSVMAMGSESSFPEKVQNSCTVQITVS